MGPGGWPPSPLAAQERPGGRPSAPDCPYGRVAEIRIENGSVFDLEETEGSRFAWAFRLANRLHMDTSPRFVRRELLLGVGDCWDPLRVAESERLLREYRFIASAAVTGTRRPDGDWILEARTRDEWTTKAKATVRLDDGIRLERAAFVEENLAGRGIGVGVFLEERREQRDFGVFLETPQTFGTRLDTGLRVGQTRVGTLLEQALVYPFLGEVGRFGFRQRYSRRDSYFPWSMGSDPRGREVLVPMREDNREVTLALRLGVPGNLTLLGAGFSRESMAFPGYPGSVELATGGNYDRTEPAPPELVERVDGQEQPRSTSRANFLLGQRSIRYLPRRGLDSVRGIQDVPVGLDVGVALGRSLAFLQSGPGRVDDLFTRVGLFAGQASPSTVVNTALRLEGRHVYGGGPTGPGWRDVLAEVDLYLYGQPSWLPAHTLFLRVSGAGGWKVDTPFQLALGGRGGVRGFGDGAFPGGRRMLVTLEDRIRLRGPAREFLDTGVTLFVDAGAMAPGDAPFGERSGLVASAGAGLRLGFPAGTGGVVRLDLAFPLGPHGRGPVFRASVGEVVGLLAGFVDEQVQRSRRAGVAQEFAGVGR